MPRICLPTSVGKAGGRMGCWVGYGAGGQADLNKRRTQTQKPVALTCSTIPKSRFPSPVSTASAARLSSGAYSFGKGRSASLISNPAPPATIPSSTIPGEARSITSIRGRNVSRFPFLEKRESGNVTPPDRCDRSRLAGDRGAGDRGGRGGVRDQAGGAAVSEGTRIGTQAGCRGGTRGNGERGNGKGGAHERHRPLVLDPPPVQPRVTLTTSAVTDPAAHPPRRLSHRGRRANRRHRDSGRRDASPGTSSPHARTAWTAPGEEVPGE